MMNNDAIMSEPGYPIQEDITQQKDTQNQRSF